MNKMVAKNGIPKPISKGFVVDNDHAKWNIAIIIYNFNDPSLQMIDYK
jgi:hypothetical protein